MAPISVGLCGLRHAVRSPGIQTTRSRQGVALHPTHLDGLCPTDKWSGLKRTAAPAWLNLLMRSLDSQRDMAELQATCTSGAGHAQLAWVQRFNRQIGLRTMTAGSARRNGRHS